MQQHQPIPRVAPTTETNFVSASHERHAHEVQFYENDHFLAAAVADYLAEGVRAGQVIIVIATQAHREAFQHRLKVKGVDAVAAALRDQIIWLDARQTLASFMVANRPDPDRFHMMVGSVIERYARTSRPAGVRAYGEMVDLLWKEGNIEATIQLEELWNELQSKLSFSLLCAYAMGTFHKSAHSNAFERICHTHTRVIPTEKYVDLPDDERSREVSALQQRAKALETEIEHRTELEQRLRVALAAKIHAEEELRRALSERDVLLQRERAARAEAEAASRAKNDFLAVMSHELRTPLNAIGGHVQLLEMGIHGQVEEAQREALQRIERSQRHLLALINDILNLTRIEAGRVQYMIEDIALAPMLNEVKSMLDPLVGQHALRLDVDTKVTRIDSSALTVRADRDKVQQILLNLVSNALKFTPAGGRISIDSGVESGAGDRAYIEVSDTGIGIDSSKLETIFQPFVQLTSSASRRPEGVGLGLSISRELARGMGGDLVAESTPGQGSSFTLTLPLA